MLTRFRLGSRKKKHLPPKPGRKVRQVKMVITTRQRMNKRPGFKLSFANSPKYVVEVEFGENISI